MDAIECLKTRRSIREYDSKSISEDIIKDIIDCARLAPTARNIQPCIFISITDKETISKFAAMAPNGSFMLEAPLCIAVFSENTKYFLEDGSAATQNIMLAGWAYNIGSCWIAGDKKDYMDDVKKELGVPDNYRLISLISMGYLNGEVPDKPKKTLDDILFKNKYTK